VHGSHPALSEETFFLFSSPLSCVSPFDTASSLFLRLILDAMLAAMGRGEGAGEASKLGQLDYGFIRAMHDACPDA